MWQLVIGRVARGLWHSVSSHLYKVKLAPLYNTSMAHSQQILLSRLNRWVEYRIKAILYYIFSINTTAFCFVINYVQRYMYIFTLSTNLANCLSSCWFYIPVPVASCFFHTPIFFPSIPCTPFEVSFPWMYFYCMMYKSFSSYTDVLRAFFSVKYLIPPANIIYFKCLTQCRCNQNSQSAHMNNSLD